ncbi:MAG: thioredoxin domain-containing protein [Acidimicrobiales bacterium]
MDVRLLYFDDCPNWSSTKDRLREALDATGNSSVTITLEKVSTIEEAEERNFTGSPTVLIDGEDAFSPHDTAPGLACRVYSSPSGLEGSLSLAQLIEVLEQRKIPRER